jgi:hypothetical protein
MVDSTTHAPVLHPPAAPDGPHVGAPWLGHCPPSEVTVRHSMDPAQSGHVGRGINHLVKDHRT